MVKKKIDINELVSSIVVSYHTGPFLWQAIETILSQEHLKELIIVDNGNIYEEQKRLDALAKENKKVKVMHLNNVGFGKGCNLGFAKSKGKYVAFINPDVVLPDKLFTPLIKELENGADIVTPLVTNSDNTEQRGCRRNLLTLATGLVDETKIYKLLPSLKKMNLTDDDIPDQAFQLEAISGSFMMMKRDYFKKIGGFDEHYFMHVEDMDLCMEVAKRGGVIKMVPTIRIMHHQGTSDASSCFVEWHKTKGFMYYFAKHFNYNLPARMMINLGILLRFVLVMLRGYLREKTR